MCYQTKITKKKEEMQRHFDAKITGLDQFDPAEVIKAFDYPKTPVITNEEPHVIQMYQWGLIPYWADMNWNRNYTLNARIETLDSKASFKNITNNRCLIIVNGFYEWQQVNYGDRGFNDEGEGIRILSDCFEQRILAQLTTRLPALRPTGRRVEPTARREDGPSFSLPLERAFNDSRC